MLNIKLGIVVGHMYSMAEIELEEAFRRMMGPL
jgi:hypothetical protein